MVTKHPTWKVHLWEKNSVEPAMLRVPLVMITFIVLWGLVMWLLDRTKVDYGFVLSKSAHLTFVFSSAAFLSVHYALHMTLFSTTFGLTVETAITIFYFVFLLTLVLPITPFAEPRNTFLRLLRQVFTPSGSVTFPEVLVADALTSISKVFKDMGITAVVVYSYFQGVDVLDYHDHAMVLIAVLATLPFMLRIRQCSIQFCGCTDFISRVPIALNICKYFSAFPPIWLTAAASLGYSIPNMPTVIAVSATVNSLYSFAWDVVMDWGFVSFSRECKVLVRQRLLLPLPTYFIALVLNLLLRFSWTVNRFPGFNKLHSSVIVLIIELGEVFRRAMWSIYRIEWEVLVRQEKMIKCDSVDKD